MEIQDPENSFRRWLEPLGKYPHDRERLVVVESKPPNKKKENKDPDLLKDNGQYLD